MLRFLKAPFLVLVLFILRICDVIGDAICSNAIYADGITIY